MIKLLIDECLSGRLVPIARSRGFFECSHVIWIGKAGWKDWQLKSLLLGEKWVLVTNNSKDFRGPRDAPGSSGQFAGLSWQPGLVCLNGPPKVNFALQARLFAKALEELEKNADLTNQVLEISQYDRNDSVDVRRYDLPKIEGQR